MEPEEAVNHLVAVLRVQSSDLGEKTIYELMEKEGVALSQAEKAYRFTQIAAGRRFLKDLGIKHSDVCWYFQPDGTLESSSLLANEPFYKAASFRASRRHLGQQAFTWLAFQSTDVQTINQMLDSGSQPSDLVAGPVCLFLQEPTSDGIARVREQLSRHVALESSKYFSPKPWWRFW